MKYSHKLSDAIHILAYVEICQDDDLSSQAIAGSIESNPSLVRRLMSLLAKSKLLTTKKGTIAPKLAKPAEEITMLDVFQALDAEQHLLHVDKKTNLQCVIGGNIQSILEEAYEKVQRAAEEEMATISLATIITEILNREAKKRMLDSVHEQV